MVWFSLRSRYRQVPTQAHIIDRTARSMKDTFTDGRQTVEQITLSTTDNHRQEAVQTTAAALPASQNRLGILIALLSLYIIWGSTYLGMRIALKGFPPFIMAGTRFVLAGGILYIVLRLRKTPAPTRKQWAGSALIGLLLIVCGNGGVNFAEQWVPSGIAAVMVAAAPLWASLFFGLMGRWPSGLEWFGLGLGFIGVILLNLEKGLWGNPLGALIMLFSPFCWALGSALSFKVSLPQGLMASATEMLIGGVVMLGLSLVLQEKFTAPPSMQSILVLLYLIIFGSLIAFTAYGYLLRRVRPALATSYAYVNPAVAVILGISLAGEHLTPIGFLAMCVILTGVALLSLRKKQS